MHRNGISVPPDPAVLGDSGVPLTLYSQLCSEQHCIILSADNSCGLSTHSLATCFLSENKDLALNELLVSYSF